MGLAILIGFAATILWLRSGVIKDGLNFTTPVAGGSIISRYDRACLMITFRLNWGWSLGVFRTAQSRWGNDTVDELEFSAAGFGFGRSTWADGSPSTWLATVPFWFIILLCLAILAKTTHTWFYRSARDQRGLCPDCGYDLRASIDRCPECGRPIDGAIQSPSTSTLSN